jgi:hypothetical protein
MRKEYAKALRDAFAKRMREDVPQFELQRVASDYVIPGERLFRWIPVEPIHCWVILKPDAKGREAFTVEVGWSTRGRFPELSMRPTPLASPAQPEALERDECVARLPELRVGEDRWWTLPDPAVERPGDLAALVASLEPISASAARQAVAPLVDDAVAAVREYGVPYLRKFVDAYQARHGKSSSPE